MSVFQLIVDTYGIANYQEANPAVISIVTFPFLFGMMFGDMGHGSIFFFFSLVLVLFNDRLKGSLADPVLPLRYIFLLMGFMSFYCGFVYNEFFALPTQIFENCYPLRDRQQWTPSLNEDATKVEGDWTYLRIDFQCVYKFGLDPVWSLSSQKLVFSNNIKMKTSVVIAILHMVIGILIKGSNSIYFRRWPDLFFEVIAGLVILLGLFGFMDALIFAKWFKELNIDDKTLVNEGELYDKLGQDLESYPEYKGDWQNNHTPSVISIMINTIFGFGNIPDEQKDYLPLIGEDQ
jgi:V-type H+-transporting ATPase subunit a